LPHWVFIGKSRPASQSEGCRARAAGKGRRQRRRSSGSRVRLPGTRTSVAEPRLPLLAGGKVPIRPEKSREVSQRCSAVVHGCVLVTDDTERPQRSVELGRRGGFVRWRLGVSVVDPVRGCSRRGQARLPHDPAVVLELAEAASHRRCLPRCLLGSALLNALLGQPAAGMRVTRCGRGRLHRGRRRALGSNQHHAASAAVLRNHRSIGL